MEIIANRTISASDKRLGNARFKWAGALPESKIGHRLTLHLCSTTHCQR